MTSKAETRVMQVPVSEHEGLPVNDEKAARGKERFSLRSFRGIVVLY